MKYTKDLVLIALLTSIIFLQEQLLSFIPNVQLTFFLLVLYSKKLEIVKSSLIILIYVIIDNLIGGSFSLLFIPFMLIGLLLIPLSLNTIFKKVESNLSLAILGIMYSFIYSFINIIPGCIMFNLTFKEYLINDLYWEIILAINSFVTILLLYNACSKIFDLYLKRG